MPKHLWLLTEERPKKEVLVTICKKFAQDQGLCIFVDSIRILPLLDDGVFTFTYEVIGVRCSQIDKIYIKTVSGNSSFTDYLVFHQNHEPTQDDTPLYAIEETKTDDSESRNTGVYQRCSKFVFIEHYYPETKKIMLYNLQITQKETPTQTSIFGTRLLLTLGVEILGKTLDPTVFVPFDSIEELIQYKNSMRRPPKGNVPILISLENEIIRISGRLYKSGSLSHDPNIGALSIISAVLRRLGWAGAIEIIHHGLSQEHIGVKNKFIQIAQSLDISLAELTLPRVEFNPEYWRYDIDGEKLGTIFIHIVVENFSGGSSIFENHAGSEKGYFITKNGEYLPLEKYMDRERYKSGEKDQIIHIPDLILIDFGRNEVINIEGKKWKFRDAGIKEIENYDFIEEHYIKKHYPGFHIKRTVVLYGSHEEVIAEIEVGFLLNEDGKLVLGVQSPTIFREAIKNLIDFWGI